MKKPASQLDLFGQAAPAPLCPKPEPLPIDTTPAVCCDQPTTWDPLRRGVTCGGLHLEGAWVCGVCNQAFLAPKGWAKHLDRCEARTMRGRVRVRCELVDGHKEKHLREGYEWGEEKAAYDEPAEENAA